jgi:hypothetical protein
MPVAARTEEGQPEPARTCRSPAANWRLTPAGLRTLGGPLADLNVTFPRESVCSTQWLQPRGCTTLFLPITVAGAVPALPWRAHRLPD